MVSISRTVPFRKHLSGNLQPRNAVKPVICVIKRVLVTGFESKKKQHDQYNQITCDDMYLQCTNTICLG